MPLTFEEFGAACEQALNPNLNGLNQSIRDTQAKIDASNAQILKDIQANNANTANYLNQQNQQTKDRLNASNQALADAFTIDKLNGAIKDAGSIVRTATGEITKIGTNNIKELISGVTSGVTSGTGLSSNMLLIVCVIGGIVVLKTINSR